MSGKYAAILIDPPWPFRTYAGRDIVPARAAQPYPTMTLDAIAALPIRDLLAPDAAVFLWQSDSLPFAASRLAVEWGLFVPTDNVFIWIKPSIGMGYWSRKEAETVVLMTKGKPRRKSAAVRQVIYAPRREHSRKPDAIYERIEALVDGPYLEMFARQRRAGWDAWGDEVDKFNAL